MIPKTMTIGGLLIITSILVMVADSAVAQTEPAAVVRLTAVRDAYPYWSSDGKQVVFQSDRHDMMMGDRDIYMMQADGTAIKRLIHREESDETPVWSPDGSKIVFASNRAGKTTGNFHIYVMNADGSDVVRILENDAMVEDARPQWSPDGSRILFNRQYIADESSIDIMIIELPTGLSVAPR